MNNVHPLFQEILNRSIVKKSEFDNFLRMPFEIETDKGTMIPYREDVLKAMDECIESHIPEIEERVLELARIRQQND